MGERSSKLGRQVASLALSLVLAGCNQLAGASGPKLGPSLGASSLDASVQTTVSGQALAPASLVGNNASALVSNNVGNLIANNINGLVSNNVSALTPASALSAAGNLAQAYGVQSLSEIPLPDVEVALLSLTGSVAATGSTDASGNFSLFALQGSYAVEAAFQVGSSTVREDNLAGAGAVQVDAASTLAIDALRSAASGSLVGFSPTDVAGVVSAVRGAMTDAAAQTLTGSQASRVAAFGQLEQQSASVANFYVTAVSNRTARLSGGGSSSGNQTTSTNTNSSSSTTGSWTSSSSTSSSSSSSGSAAPTLALSQFSTGAGISLGTDSADGGVPELIATGPSAASPPSDPVAVPQGGTLSFSLLLGSGTLNPASGYPAYLALEDGTGNILLEAALLDATSGGIPSGVTSCGASTPQQGNKVVCAASENQPITFNLTAPAGVARIVFGGAGTTFTAGLEQVSIAAN